MGVWGTYKGAHEFLKLGKINQLPRLLCVQQESCSPMVHAFEEGSDSIRPHHIVERPFGIASAILRGNPTKAYPYVRRIVMDSNGGFVSVSEADIRKAKSIMEDQEGISPCFTSATAVAGLAKMVAAGKVPANDTVVINLTGGDRNLEANSKHTHWLHKTEQGWSPDTSDQEAVRFWPYETSSTRFVSL
jgi:threonine synthase